MDAGERTTGTRDEHYDLISVLYHALHGAENCEVYATDAQAAGDADLAAFFREAQVAQRQLAEQAKARLGIRGTVRGTATERGGVRRGTAAPPHGAVGPAEEPSHEIPPEGVAGPEREREEDKGLLDRARDAILGEEEEPGRGGRNR